MSALALLLSLSAPAGGGSAPCERLLASLADAKRHAVDWRTASELVQVSGLPSFCTGWTVFSVQRRPDGRLMIRREIANAQDQRTVMWADDRRCPAVRDVIEAFSRIRIGWQGLLPPPRPPGPPFPVPPPPPPEDGTDWMASVSSARQPDGSSAAITVRSNYGTIADWAEKDVLKLDGCWGGAPPP